MTRARQQHVESWRAVAELAERVPPAEWDLPTPCAEWNARALAGHLVVGARMVQAMLTAGEPVVPVLDPRQLARVVGADPATALRAVADAVSAELTTISDTATVATPHGEMAVSAFLGMAVIEPVVHGWDLSVATGEPVYLDDDAVAMLLTGVGELGGQLAATGMYAASRDGAPDAPAIDRLAAALGR